MLIRTMLCRPKRFQPRPVRSRLRWIPSFHYYMRSCSHAAASAQCVTGAPLMIHVEMGSDPIRLFKFLSDCGVPAESMLFCHMDRSSPDLRQHHFLLKQGAYLECDTIGRFKYHSDQDELSTDPAGAGLRASERQLLLRWTLRPSV
ncbi:MAG: hypothetical protein ACLS3C_06870 [Oscillospiraceae bacterium]